MIPKYGTYAHAEGELEIDAQQEALFNEARQPYGKMIRVTLSGLLLADSPTAMDVKVRNLLTAYSTSRTFALYLPGGSTKSQIVLDHATAIGGVRVVQPPSFPTMRGAGYVTNLPYTIRLEAEYAATGASLLYRDFEETIEVEGGGPQIGWLKPLNARPVSQVLRRMDTYRARQSGFAIGLYARPSAMPPLWPNFLTAFGRFGKRSPKPKSGVNTDYLTTWDYQFESDRPLLGEPHSWQT